MPSTEDMLNYGVSVNPVSQNVNTFKTVEQKNNIQIKKINPHSVHSELKNKLKKFGCGNGNPRFSIALDIGRIVDIGIVCHLLRKRRKK